ncbi:MAG: cyclase family protein [Armatimonadota bacterium]|nr:cyclase family protein [Armatimonadota bacterium]
MDAVATGRVDRAKEPGALALSTLLHALARGTVKVVDLGDVLNEQTLVIQLPPPFANTPGFKKHPVSEYDEKGPAWAWHWYEIGEHVGTHFDAPTHWITGRHLAALHSLDPRTLIGPACVVDIEAEAAANPDVVVTKDMLLAWEARYGRIPDGAWVLVRSGWARRARDADAFFNLRDDGPHTPGMGATGAKFLVEERNIVGVGVETIGTDAGQAGKENPPFPNHAIMHGHGKYGLTSLVNLDQLPPTGAVLIVLPLKVEGGTGCPVRPMALVPAS